TANASSFAMMGEPTPTATPSIVALGTPGPKASSIRTMGEPLPAVADETVAAIPPQRRRGPALAPLVIRGGIAGTAFAPARPADKTDKPAPAAQSNEQASASQGEPAGQPATSEAPPAYVP